MIKKKYFVAVMMVIIVVAVSTIRAYKMNYNEYMEETKGVLMNFSESAYYQYDSIFKQISNSVDKIYERVEKEGWRDHRNSEFQKFLYSFSEASLYIDDISVGFMENGEYRFHDKYFDNQNIGIKKILQREVSDFWWESPLAGILDMDENKEEIYIVARPDEENGIIAVITANYGIMNKVANPDTYEIFGGHMYLLSQEGRFVYHKRGGLIGKSLFYDQDYIEKTIQIDEKGYDMLKDLISYENIHQQEKELCYYENGVEKIGYYKHLNNFPGAIIFVVEHAKLKKIQVESAFRNLIPLFICLIIAIAVLLKYIFLIKYTDYFTEVKNELAMRKSIKTMKKNGMDKCKILVIKIDEVISMEDRDCISDDRIFYAISNHIKTLKDSYKELFRMFRLYYMIVLEDDVKVDEFIEKLNMKVKSKDYGEIEIRGKRLLVDVDSIEECEIHKMDGNIIKYMEKENEDLLESDIEDYTLYSSIEEQLERRNQNKIMLEKTVEEGKVVINFKPIVGLEKKQVEMYEVLFAIKDGEDKASTMGVLQMADEEGMMRKLDCEVIKQAFQYYREVFLEKKKALKLVIIISGLSLNSEFIEFISQTAKDNHIDRDNITFEIRGIGNHSNIERKIKYFKKLKRNAFHVALHNFEGGHAHVELLSKFKVDYVKIKGAFIQGVESDQRKLKTLNALVYLGKNYGAKIIAESVDTGKCLEVVKKLECEYVQGDYLGGTRDDIQKISQWSVNPGIF